MPIAQQLQNKSRDNYLIYFTDHPAHTHTYQFKTTVWWHKGERFGDTRDNKNTCNTVRKIIVFWVQRWSWITTGFVFASSVCYANVVSTKTGAKQPLYHVQRFELHLKFLGQWVCNIVHGVTNPWWSGWLPPWLSIWACLCVESISPRPVHWLQLIRVKLIYQVNLFIVVRLNA